MGALVLLSSISIWSCQKPGDWIGSGAVEQQVANCVASVRLTLVSTWWTSNCIAATLLLHCYYIVATLLLHWSGHGGVSGSHMASSVSHPIPTLPREFQTPRGFPYFSKDVPAFKIRWFLTHTLLKDFLYLECSRNIASEIFTFWVGIVLKWD